MTNLTNMLKTFLSENEWNINKLRGGDVVHYILENISTDDLLLISKESSQQDLYINEYGDLVVIEGTTTYDTLLEDGSDVALLLLKDLT